MSCAERLVFMSPIDPPAPWADAIRQAAPEIAFLSAHDVPEDPAGIQWAVVWKPPHGSLARLPDLKCVFSLGAGVDHVLEDEAYPRDVPLSRVVDPHLTASMSEYVVMHVLGHHRGLKRTMNAQAARRWEWSFPQHAEDVRVGMMGLGELGLDAARKLRPFGYRLLGWSATRKDEPGIESFAGLAELENFLAQTDILVCLLPLTPATQGILNSHTFDLLPKGARIINAARGAHLIEADLLHALDEGHLAGATLDVFAEEPLPQTSRLWDHPKVIVTPHVAATADPRATVASMVESMARIRAGGRPLNEVDLTRGY